MEGPPAGRVGVSVGPPTPGAQARIRDFAARYAAAWTGHSAATVAAFFAPQGRIAINGGEPSIGATAIEAMAQDFFDAFPDLVVEMDDARQAGEAALFAWTLVGAHRGSGRGVRIAGWEEWTLSADGRIARSLGHFDADDLERQIREGVSPAAG